MRLILGLVLAGGALALFLVLAAWLAVASERGEVPGALLGALGVAAAVVIVAWLVTGLFARYCTRGPTARTSRIGTWADEAQAAAHSCLRRPVLTPAILLGLPFQGLVMLAFWLVARSIALQRRALDFVSARHDLGAASGLEVAQQQALLDTTLAQVDLLRRQRGVFEHAVQDLPMVFEVVADKIAMRNVVFAVGSQFDD